MRDSRRRSVCLSTTLFLVLILAGAHASAQSVIATIPTAARPASVAVNPMAHRVYVTAYYGGSVSVIDALKQSVTTTVPIRSPWGVAVHPGLDRYYVSRDYGYGYAVLDGLTNAWLAAPSTPRWTRAIAVNEQANEVYLSNIYDNRVRIWDAVGHAELAQVPVSGWVYDFAVDVGRHVVYAANGGASALTVIDVAAGSARDVPIGGGDPRGVAFNARTDRIYVANANAAGGGELVVVDAGSLSILKRMTINGAMKVAVSEPANRVYLTCYTVGQVAILDGATDTWVATVPVGGLYPDGIAVYPELGLVYVADGLGTSTVTVIQDLLPNTAPQADAGVGRTVEATSRAGAAVTLNGTGSSDADGDALTFTWSAPGIVFADPTSPTPTATFPFGQTSVTLTVTDDDGATDQADVVVEVVDTTAPVISRLVVNPGSLWPPNHKLVSVTATVDTADVADPTPVARIVSVTSSEPVTGLFGGDVGADWVLTGTLSAQLRAERAGRAPGRIYTVTIESRDAAGNVATATVTVLVPHDRGK